MTRIALLAAPASLALLLAGCGADSTPANTDDMAGANAVNMDAANMGTETAPATAPSGQAFADNAAASDAFEIETSKLAAEKSSNAEIKKFAQQMIDAHTESTAKLKTAASSAAPAIVPNPVLTAEQQSKLTALKAQTGAAFDTAYAQEQVAAHQMTLDALQAYARGGDVPQLKDFAASMVPIVSGHLDMAKALKP